MRLSNAPYEVWIYTIVILIPIINFLARFDKLTFMVSVITKGTRQHVFSLKTITFGSQSGPE